MISADCDFERFVGEIRGKDCYEMILLAEKEATEAWRRGYNHRSNDDENDPSRRYQEKLIGLIDYMRHGLKPSIFSDQDLQLCSQLHNESGQPHTSVATDGYLNLTG